MIILDLRLRTAGFWIGAFIGACADELGPWFKRPAVRATLLLSAELLASIAFAIIFLLAAARWFGGAQ